MRKTLRFLPFIALLFSTRAVAQDSPLQMFFNEFNGVAVWGGISLWNTERQATSRSFLGLERPAFYGFELLLGPYPSNNAHEAVIGNLSGRADSLEAEAQYRRAEWDQRTADSLLRKAERLRASIEELEADAKRQNDEAWSIELGFGFEFSDSHHPVYDSLAFSLPVSGASISVYAYPPWFAGLHPVGVYFGGSAGLSDLSTATAYRQGTPDAFELSSATFTFNMALGLYYEWTGNSVYLEASYKYLAFDAIRYMPQGEAARPLHAPSRIDLSGVYLTVGMQFAKK
jgi:hypothetical protein